MGSDAPLTMRKHTYVAQALTLIVATLALGALLGIGYLVSLVEGGEPPLALLGFAGLLCAFALVPYFATYLPSLRVDSAGIREVPVLGLSKRYPWGAIANIVFDNGVVIELLDGTSHRVSALYITGLDRKRKKVVAEGQGFATELQRRLAASRETPSGN
jgi:hypothetical protein